MEALQFRHSAKLADSMDCMQCIACRHRGGESLSPRGGVRQPLDSSKNSAGHPVKADS